MTNLPDDQIDPYEQRLTRRVGAFAEQAVRPIDATAIAAAAAAGARRRTIAGRLFGSISSTSRLGVVLAGALVGAAVLGVIGAGGQNGPGPSQTATANGPGPSQTATANGPGPSQTTSANGPEATPTSVPGSVDACAANGLAAEITAWEGAAGHRIATVKIRNTTASACALPRLLRPVLIEQAGNALILGTPPQPAEAITIAASASATTLVDMVNYCGTDPTSPLGIRLYLPSDTAVEAYPAAGVALPIDPPPCNGPNQAASIEMQPLQLTAAGQ